MKVVILGAGPSGLSAGWKLAEKGVSVDIIESEPRAGGLCASLKYKEFIFDYGGHRFCTENPSLSSEIKKLMGTELKTRKRKSKIYIKGKYLEYPLKLTNLLIKMDIRIIFAALFDYIIGIIKRKISPVPEITFEDWVINRFGKVLFEIYFRPYSEKVWGVPTDKLTVEMAEKRITLVGLWDVVARLFGKKSDIPPTYMKEFFYPEKGIGRICERLSEEIEHNGGTIYLNSAVEKVNWQGNCIKSVDFKKGVNIRRLSADYVISTIPIPDLFRYLTPGINVEYLKTAESLSFRCLVFLYLIIDKVSVTENNWIYFSEKDYIFSRIVEPKNWSSFLAPEDKTSLCVEIPCSKGDRVWNMADGELFELVIGGLERVKLLTRDKVLEYFTVKSACAYPRYDLDNDNKIGKLKDCLGTFDNISVCGRQGLFDYTTMAHCMEMGIKAADRLILGINK